MATVDAGQLPNLLTINPTVAGFNAAGVGSTTSGPYISVYNPGNTAVTITGISISGPAASDFSAGYNYCTTVNPGQYCEIYPSFTPTAVGLRVAALVVKDTGGAPQSVVLTGEGMAASPAVTFSVPELTFPSLPVGLPSQNAAIGYISVENTGNAPVTFQSIVIVGADPGDFWITYNGCTFGPLPAGNSCPIDLSFLPAATGMRNAALQVIDNAQGGVQSLPLMGLGTPPTNSLQLFPNSVAFTPTGTSNNESALITVENTGSEAITINGFLVTGPNAPDFSLVQNYCQPIPYTLAAQSQCNLQVQFTPGALGARVANLEVVDSAPGSPQTVPLDGSGVRATFDLSYNPSLLDFGDAIQGAAPSYGQLMLTNLGSEGVPISIDIQGVDAADFSVPYSCTYLYPGSVCYQQVEFTPSTLGTRVATLVATDTAGGQSKSATLIGSGVAAATPFTASSFIIPSVTVGNTGQGSVYLYSQNSSPVTITSITMSGAAKSDFGILQNDCSVLYPFSSCYMEFSFTPSAVGTRVAQMNVAYSGGSSPVTVPLAATGLAPAPTLAFGAAELDFTGQLHSTSNDSVYVENTGTEAFTISAVSLAGTAAADYAITGNQCPQSPATLAPGASCLVTVEFTPSALGTRLARLQVTDAAAGSPQSLPLVGFGVNGAPALQIGPDALTFNSSPLGSSSQLSIVLSALSSSSVSLTGFKITGSDAADFTETNNCPAALTTTLCYVYVTFTPSASGLRIAALQIQDNAAGNPQIVPLAGMGLKPSPPTTSISLTPVPLVFPQAQGVGYTASASVGLTNTGTQNVLITGFHIGGAAASDFGVQSDGCPISPAPLVPGEQCIVSIAFTPSVAGVRMASLSVTDNASGSPQSISMVGEGVAPVKTLAVSPASATFSPTPVGTTDFSGAIMTVTDSGTVPVPFKSFAIAGPDASDFSIETNFCLYFGPLNPGSYCQIYLNFTPSATGTRTAELTIGSDATDSLLKVPLTGTGQ